MSKFTPGPWKLENPAPDYLRVMAGDQEIAFFNEDSLGVQQFKANGNLVAAAPEMFNILVDCEKLVENLSVHSDTFDLFLNIKNVLAKARGENV